VVVVFTNTFPYEKGETFFETELPFLLALKRPMQIVPLYGTGEARPLPSAPEAPVTLSPPLLSFPPQNRSKLLLYGLFNRAPFFFAFKELFAQKAWRSPRKMWRLGTSWLLIRAALSKNRGLFDRLIKTAHSQQITLYFYWGDKSALLLPFLKKRAPFHKTVVRFHGSDLYEEANGIHPFRRLLFPSIDLACPVSQHGAHYLQQRYGPLSPPISIARLGTSDWGLNPEPHPTAPFHIVTCARLIPLKRLHLIWETLLLLYQSQRLPVPVRWTIIGEGPLRRELEEAVKTIDTSTPSRLLSVHFTGQLSHDDVLDLYRKTPIDLFMLTSKSEGVPVSIMEALSFGIPAIATAVGGVPEVVSHQTGYLLPANPTPTEVAEPLLDFILLPQDKRKIIRQAARASWELNWNAEVNFARFCALL